MSELDRLADAVGLARHWRDARGDDQIVSDAALTAVLGELGYSAGSEAAIGESLDRCAKQRQRVPILLTAEVGLPIVLPEMLAGTSYAELSLEAGPTTTVPVTGGVLPAIPEPGYHRLSVAGHELTLAVAPRRCFGIDAISSRRLWGPAVQIYALRNGSEHAYGGFGELAEAAALFGRRGADAMAISPVHALYPGCGARFSPYSPSSRLFLNTALADPASVGLPPLPPTTGGALIDWTAAMPQRLAALGATFAGLDDAQRHEVAAWADHKGETLRRHALYDALFCRFQPDNRTSWRDWPAAYHDPVGEAAQRFAIEHHEEVELHLFTQWLAEQGLARAQAKARNGGMAIGLIADLAVGVDPGGSDGWSLGAAMFKGLTIGAPPDPLGPEGQNWGLTSFSPQGLAATGFAPFIAMLRAALEHAGGVRIDHAFGLSRLWLVPAGGGPGDGAYLSFPFNDLQRIIALESHRTKAIVIAEDLGTAPWGFGEALAERDMLGMRVLWFEREQDGGFRSADHYEPRSVAMSSTHDTATVAGWWQGRDIAWSDRLGRFADEQERAIEEWHRGEDRTKLWAAIGHGAPQPAPDDPASAVAAALAQVAATASRLAIVPLEDLLAAEEAPNIPGTIDTHPNWRRRLPAPLAELLAEPETAARIETLSRARGTE